MAGCKEGSLPTSTSGNWLFMQSDTPHLWHMRAEYSECTRGQKRAPH